MKNRLPEASGGRFLCCMVRMLLPAQFCVGGDAYIAPLGTIEFAEDFRKIGITRRVDVGIDPYERFWLFLRNCSTLEGSDAKGRAQLLADLPR